MLRSSLILRDGLSSTLRVCFASSLRLSALLALKLRLRVIANAKTLVPLDATEGSKLFFHLSASDVASYIDSRELGVPVGEPKDVRTSMLMFVGAPALVLVQRKKLE